MPPGRAHTWSNVGEHEACIRVEFEPALRTEMFFETFFGLAKDGKTNSKGLPNLLSMAVIMREYEAEMQLASPPAVVQRALFTPLALVGRTLGYRGWYPALHGRAHPATRMTRERPARPARIRAS